MSNEAGWIAIMLAVLLIVVALLSPRAAGRLPTLEEVGRPPAARPRRARPRRSCCRPSRRATKPPPRQAEAEQQLAAIEAALRKARALRALVGDEVISRGEALLQETRAAAQAGVVT